MYENYREIPSPLQAIWNILDDYAATKPSVIRCIFRATGFLLLTLVLIGPYAVCGFAYPAGKRPVAAMWFKACLKFCGLKVRINGTVHTRGATLFVANHASYLDILVLGSLVDARFVAKRDVASWPLFGLLAKLANTIFVTRDRKRAVCDCAGLSDALQNDESLILFPEGTSSNGLGVLQFRSTLFACVDPRQVPSEIKMQPISIAYTRYADGRRLKGELTDLYAWYGDMTLADHLLSVFGLKGAVVDIHFMPPIQPAAFQNRKTLATAAESAVRSSLEKAHANA